MEHEYSLDIATVTENIDDINEDKINILIPSIFESSKTALENKEILEDESNVAHDLSQQQLLERDEKDLCDSSSLVLHNI